MSKFFIVLFLSLVVYFGGTYEAQACDCDGRVPGIKGVQTCGAYWYSEAIFTGLAEKITTGNGAMKVTFAVEKPIRGVTEKTIEVFTSDNEGSCGYPFKEGERYFVYASKGSSGKLGESLCGPTVLLKDAEDDLEYVKDLEAGKFGSRIYGNVYEDKQKSYNEKRSFEKLAGIEITIKGDTGKKNKFKTKTDENGFYIFKDIPPDVYRVTAKFPQALREIMRDDLVARFAVIYKDNARCGTQDFVATRQGSIRGKIVGQNGEIPLQQRLSLFPLDENGNVMPYRAPEEKYANRETGEFFFKVVPAGRYLLAINLNNCPYPTNGFPAMYFPGARDKTAARIINVNDGEHLSLEDFRILPVLKERWFSGVVLNADKTPAAGVKVRLLDGNMNKCSNFHLEVKTDEAGRFRLQGFETYEYQVDASAERKPGQKYIYAKPFIIPQSGKVEDIQLILDQSL